MSNLHTVSTARRRLTAASLAFLAMALGCGTAIAQAYPSKPVSGYVAYPAGGATVRPMSCGWPQRVMGVNPCSTIGN